MIPGITASAVEAWTPAQLSGLALWLRADDLSAQADASAVSSWVDRVAAYNFTQATGAKQPTFYKSTAAHLINGQPTVYCDGVDDLLVYAGIIGTPTSGHLIIIGQTVSLPTSGNAESIFSSADEASSTRYIRGGVFNVAGTSRLNVTQRDADTNDSLAGTTVAITNGTDAAWEWASSGTAYAMRVNGTVETLSVLAGADTGDWFGDTSGRDNVVIGCLKRSDGEISHADFDVAEIIRVDNQSISAGDRTSLNAYINARYGITMA